MFSLCVLCDYVVQKRRREFEPHSHIVHIDITPMKQKIKFGYEIIQNYKGHHIANAGEVLPAE